MSTCAYLQLSCSDFMKGSQSFKKVSTVVSILSTLLSLSERRGGSLYRDREFRVVRKSFEELQLICRFEFSFALLNLGPNPKNVWLLTNF